MRWTPATIVLTTVISDDDTATWSIAGDPTVTEGDAASYTVSLSGTLQDGETATIELAIADVDTTSDDYADFVHGRAGRDRCPHRSELRCGATLTYTGDGSPMTDLVISLAASDDDAGGGRERSSRSAWTNPGSTTGSDIALDASNDVVTTAITDNDTATWSIAGDPTVTEGDAASYTVNLCGTLQDGRDRDHRAGDRRHRHHLGRLCRLCHGRAGGDRCPHRSELRSGAAR